MSKLDVLDVVRSELAAYEYKMRTDGASLKRAVDAHMEELLTHGVNWPGTTDEYRAQCLAEALAYADRGAIRAAALTRVSVIVARVLRAIGGELIYDRDCVPPTVRQPRLNERQPMVMPPLEAIIESAKEHGIFHEEGNESESPLIDVQSLT